MHKTTEELLLHLLPGTGTVQFLPGPRSRGNNVVMSSDVDKLREALLSRLYSEVGIWLPVADSAVEELVTTIAKSEVRKVGCWSFNVLPVEALWKLCEEAQNLTEIDWTTGTNQSAMIDATGEPKKYPYSYHAGSRGDTFKKQDENRKLSKAKNTAPESVDAVISIAPPQSFPHLTSFSIHAIGGDVDAVLLRVALRSPKLQTFKLLVEGSQSPLEMFVFEGLERTNIREVVCDCVFYGELVNAHVGFLARLVQVSPLLTKLTFRHASTESANSDELLAAVASHPNLCRLTILTAYDRSFATKLLTPLIPVLQKFESLIIKDDNEQIAHKLPKSGFVLMGSKGDTAAALLESLSLRFSKNVTSFAVSKMEFLPVLEVQNLRSLTLHQTVVDAAKAVALSTVMTLQELSLFRCENVAFLDVIKMASNANLKTLVFDNCSGQSKDFMLTLICDWLRRPNCRLEHFALTGERCEQNFLEICEVVSKNKSLRVLDLTDCQGLFHVGFNNGGFNDASSEQRARALANMIRHSKTLSTLMLPMHYSLSNSREVADALTANVSLVNVVGVTQYSECDLVLKRNRMARIFCRTCALCTFWCARACMGRDVARIISKEVWNSRTEVVWADTFVNAVRSDHKLEDVLKQAPYELAILVEGVVVDTTKEGKKCIVM